MKSAIKLMETIFLVQNMKMQKDTKHLLTISEKRTMRRRLYAKCSILLPFLYKNMLSSIAEALGISPIGACLTFNMHA